MPYPFDQIFAADPDNTEMVATNAPVVIFAPGDETKTPLKLTTLNGLPLENPITVNDRGFGPAFISDLDQVAWEGGGLTGLMASYRGLKDDAETAAQEAALSREAAEEAARNTVAPTAEVVAEALTSEGPAREAVNAAVSAGTANLALKPDNGARAIGKGELVVSVKPTGGDDVPSIRAALTEVTGTFGQGGTLLFTPGDYHLTSTSTFTRPGSSTFPRYCFWVPANVKLVGQSGAVLRDTSDYDGRKVIFYLEGSNISFEGLTFRNDHDMAKGSRPTSIPIGAGDAFNASSTTNVNNIRIQNCNFYRSWHPIKWSFNQDGGSVTSSGVIVSHCVSYGEPLSTSSGGYNFNAKPAGRIKNVSVTASQCYDVTVSAAIGYYGVHDGAVSANICRGSQLDGGGIQLEDGADNIAISGNTLIDHFNHIWVDDSSNVAISGNNLSNTTADANFKGVRITKQGYTEDPNKLVTDIMVTGNVLRNCFIAVEDFSAPRGAPTFGSLVVTNNLVRLDGVTNSRGIGLAGSISCQVSGNRVIGAASTSIQIAPLLNQYLVVEGNITTKAGSETSTGFRLTNSNAWRPVVTGNVWVNGMAVSQPVNTSIGDTRIYTHTGAPEGTAAAPPGSLYLRSDAPDAASALYIKGTGTGNTGWVAK